MTTRIILMKKSVLPLWTVVNVRDNGRQDDVSTKARGIKASSNSFSPVFLHFISGENICAHSWSGVRLNVRSHSNTFPYNLIRSLIRLYTNMTSVPGFKTFQKTYMAFKNTHEWPECNSDQATVDLVVCSVYTGGQPCEKGLRAYS